MPVVEIGHHSAVEVRGGQRQSLPGNRVTTVHIPENYSRDEQVSVITAQDGVLANHSESGEVDWVQSSDSDLAKSLASEFGCRVGRPRGWTQETDQ